MSQTQRANPLQTEMSEVTTIVTQILIERAKHDDQLPREIRRDVILGRIAAIRGLDGFLINTQLSEAELKYIDNIINNILDKVLGTSPKQDLQADGLTNQEFLEHPGGI